MYNKLELSPVSSLNVKAHTFSFVVKVPSFIRDKIEVYSFLSS